MGIVGLMKMNLELIIKVIIYIKSWSAENIVMLLEEQKYYVCHFSLIVLTFVDQTIILIDRLT